MNRTYRVVRSLVFVLATLSSAAMAAGLGKLTVLSGLGQPMRAEIDLIAVPAEELSAVSARVAPPDVYRDSNIEYNAAVANIKFAVEKRGNNQAFIKVTSAQPIEEPFLELLVEVSWPSGKLLREYPILLDPPGFTNRELATAAPRAPAPPRRVDAAPPSRGESVPPIAVTPDVTSAAKPSATPKPGPATAAAAGESGADSYGPVKRGETLRSIAQRMTPAGAQLEQVMVALYRENAGAFGGKNMNYLKTGQILKVPSGADIAKVSAAEAHKIIRTQTARWAAYRQRLASAVAKAPAKAGANAQQSAQGQVTQKPEDKPTPAAGEDVLAISKGQAGDAGKGGKTGAKARERIASLEEEAAAREGALREANSRVADLERQVNEMRELLKMKGSPVASTEPAAPPKPADVVAKTDTPKTHKAPKPEAPKPEAAKPEAPKSAETTPSPDVTAPMPPKVDEQMPKPPVVVPPKPRIKRPAPPPPPPEPSLMDTAMETATNPLVLGGIGALVLGVLGLTYVRKRRAQQLGAFTASNLGQEPMSAGAAAGVAASTAPSPGAAEKKSGLVETSESAFLSEFNKVAPGAAEADDVDPVAEADVYLAYGRDAQAEEILREAMPKDPSRVEIPLKLLEIYAGRKSVPAFEAVAQQLLSSVGEDHPAWAKAKELGREIDPANSLYAGGTGRADPSLGSDSELGRTNVISFPASERKAGGSEPGGLDKDSGLDFDLALGDAPAVASPTASAVKAPAASGAIDFDFSELGPEEGKSNLGGGDQGSSNEVKFDLDFDLDLPAAGGGEPTKTASSSSFDIDFDLESNSSATTSAVRAPSADHEKTRQISASHESTAQLSQTKGAKFDFSSVNLDLEQPAGAAASEASSGDSPMWRTAATKLDLARAYMELGDKDGAKEIIDEVMRDGSPQQKEEAQKLSGRL